MNPTDDRIAQQVAGGSRAGQSQPASLNIFILVFCALAILALAPVVAQTVQAAPVGASASTVPPRVAEARRFLAQRGWTPGHRLPQRGRKTSTAVISASSARPMISVQVQSGSSATWTALGPAAVQTSPYGLVSGRVTSIALDPADTTGNHVYLGTTGGGVWVASNAAVSNASQVVFTPLTDSLSSLGGVADASISIGALTVQPGGTGVVLAGTGDPNDVLDSYYGAGILRSTDGGTTWSLIAQTNDLAAGLSAQNFSFLGEGFAGFAWSTVNAQVVVAAVSQAYEGELVDATAAGGSTQGLFYSQDSGATWHLATITDGAGEDVQGPLDVFAQPDGNAATAVVWNPIRKLFIAAVRYHGYYQSPDGVTWTRLTAQPGSGLTTAMCPTDTGTTGSIACPIFRGALAVNPQNGDTFAWTVDLNNQDQGIWQDVCSAGSACLNPSLTFAQQWATAALETSTTQGAATIPDGVYNLALAAVPSGQISTVFAGANDLWQSTCPASQGCSWRNTTNSTTCMSAEVGEFQHALAWSAANPLEVLIGNDSGLWRSMDAVAETGTVCSAADANHFQNLNGGLGSLAEVNGMSRVVTTPYAMLAGFGVNGAAGVNAGSVTTDWPQLLGGYGGPVAIDPQDTSDWYANNQPGVAIYLCPNAAGCTPATFAASPVVTEADVSNDGVAMPNPASFLVDPLDHTQLMVGTCRVWRGPASASGWTAANAISPILDSGSTTGSCQGDALIRSMAATAVSGNEVIYVGTYGSADGGSRLPGHILSATFNPSGSSMPVWHDLTFNSVANDTKSFNHYNFDVSSIAIDPHDVTGDTVYASVAGISSLYRVVQTLYRSTNGGATWSAITSNLPNAPVNAIAVDPQSASTIYVATDIGAYYTTEVASCSTAQNDCWSPFGTGLPEAPVVALSASAAGAASQVLVAGTYGRGMWQTGLWTSGASLSAASANPSALVFQSQVFDTTSAARTVTIVNTGSIALQPTSIAFTGDSSDFAATGNCAGQTIAVGGSCTIQVTFTPQATGQRTAQMVLYANIYGGQVSVDLNGTGLPGGVVNPSPLTLAFGQVEVGSSATPLQVTLTNSGSAATSISNISVTAPFTLASDACGASLAGGAACQVTIGFVPTQAGAATGQAAFSDGGGTQTVRLTGTGAAAPTDTLSPTSLSFPSTASGQISAAQTVTITNSGDLALQVTSIAASANFAQSNSCASGVAAHSTCSISVEFAPTQTGALTGTLTLTDALGSKTVALSGTGLPPASFTVTPASLTFAQQQPGITSAPQTLTITNSGGVSAANIGFQITGPAAASYSIGATTCGAVLNSGAQCTVQISFTPSATGSISAALSISSSTTGIIAASVPLNGAGQLAAGFQTNPAQLPFTTVVPVGQSSSAQSVVITNTSNYSIGSIAVAATGPFSLAQNTCTGSLGAGATCTAAVVFAPSISGSSTGVLTVSSSVVTQPATVALSGTGFNFTLAASGPTAQTVTSGQQADYKLVITPSGATGAFTFQCGTLPANSLCIFNPTTESLAAGVQGNVEVEIYTGNSGLNVMATPPTLGRALPMVCGILLLPLALWRRRRIFAFALLALVLSAGITSCAGAIGGTGGSSNGGTGGTGTTGSTPAGTYSVPVTVTSSGLSQSITLTLTVD